MLDSLSKKRRSKHSSYSNTMSETSADSSMLINSMEIPKNCTITTLVNTFMSKEKYGQDSSNDVKKNGNCSTITFMYDKGE